MMEKINENVPGVKTLPKSPVSNIDTIFVGENSVAIISAKEMLISAYVKSLINKRKTDDI